MNLYRVKLGKASGVVHVSEYVVISESEQLAVYGNGVREEIYKRITEYDIKYDGPLTEDMVLTEMRHCEMPLIREEMDRCSIYKGSSIRAVETIELIAPNVADQYECFEGKLICLDYYPG